MMVFDGFLGILDFEMGFMMVFVGFVGVILVMLMMVLASGQG